MASRGKPESLFARVMMTFLACILPLTAVQLAMYTWGTRVVRTELYESASANATYLRDDFDDRTRQIITRLHYILNYGDVVDFFVYAKNYSLSDYYAQVEKILNLLTMIRSDNPLIEEIHLALPPLGIEIISGKNNQLTHVDTKALTDRFALFLSQGSGYMVRDGAYLVGASKPTMVAGGRELPAYYVEAVLSIPEMSKRLSSFHPSHSSISLQYHHGTELFLFSDGKQALAQEALAQTLCSIRKEGVQAVPVSFGPEEYTLIACYSRLMNTTFGQLLSTRDLEHIPRTFQAFVFGFAMLSLLVVLLLATSVRRMVTNPTHALLSAFGATGQGHFDTRINGRRYAREYRALAERFNEMNDHIQALIESNYEHTISLQHAQIKQLQAQINPHFLYNSFFLLKRMVREGETEQSARFLNCLGRYFHYITEESGLDTTTLEREYGHARDYLEIQLLRFEDALQLDIAPLPEPLRQVPVLRLILQPLFENVMTHCSWRDGDVRKIRLSFSEIGGMLRIAVEDNGRQVSDDALSAVRAQLDEPMPLIETSGLRNIHRRLLLQYGGRGGLVIERSGMGGFCVIIQLPLEEGAHADVSGFDRGR